MGHTWPLARGQQFATCTVPVHVAKCKWRKSCFFVVNVACLQSRSKSGSNERWFDEGPKTRSKSSSNKS
jgi:hypothetical protein